MTPLAYYQWYKHGMKYVVLEATLYADENTGIRYVSGSDVVAPIVAEFIKFMYKMGVKKLVLDEYTIVEMEK